MQKHSQRVCTFMQCTVHPSMHTKHPSSVPRPRPWLISSHMAMC
uniref:Uncharacterized protein n=1 Tax=Arundo donax TaxID=35708 RepID=A0A0A9GP38_ARUDO